VHHILFDDSRALARAVMKLASAQHIAERAAGHVRGAFRHAGEAGSAAARGFGAGETGQRAGQIAGYSALGGAGLVGASKVKKKVDRFKAEHNFGDAAFNPYAGY
jgi:hypothetical protein